MKSSKNKKVSGLAGIVALAGVLIVIFMVIIVLFKTVGGEIEEYSDTVNYPVVELSEEPDTYIYTEPDPFFTEVYQFPSCAYDVVLPGKNSGVYLDMQNGRIVCSYMNLPITLVIAESEIGYQQEALNYLLEADGELIGYLSNVNFSYEEKVLRRGYLNGFHTSFSSGRVDVVRDDGREAVYVVAYELECGTKDIFISGYSRESSQLFYMSGIIEKIIKYMSPVEKVSALPDASLEAAEQEETVVEIEESVSENTVDKESVAAETEKEELSNEIPLYPIEDSLTIYNDMGESVAIFMWANGHEIAPVSLELITPDGRTVQRNWEESYPGFYIYYLDSAPAGTYYIKGKTTGTLRLTYFDMGDMNYYRNQYLGESGIAHEE